MDVDENELSTAIFAPESGQTIVEIHSFEDFLKFFPRKYVH
jgi:hypothetical protein